MLPGSSSFVFFVLPVFYASLVMFVMSVCLPFSLCLSRAFLSLFCDFGIIFVPSYSLSYFCFLFLLMSSCLLFFFSFQLFFPTRPPLPCLPLPPSLSLAIFLVVLCSSVYAIIIATLCSYVSFLSVLSCPLFCLLFPNTSLSLGFI